MYRLIEDVISFHDASDLKYDVEPTAKHSDERDLQIDLIEEELEELKTAYRQENLEEIADAITDLLYVVIGAYVRFGLANHALKLWNEVHQSNLTKAGASKRVDGKQEKGENFVDPDINAILSIEDTGLYHYGRDDVGQTQDFTLVG